MTATWAQYSGCERVQAAYEALCEALTGPGADPVLAGYWAVLDGAATGSTLPAQWERLTGVDVAAWLGITPGLWRTTVATGYGPSADGTDGAGRSWWHPTTIETYRRGGWEPTAGELARRPLAGGRPAGTVPPVRGYGSGASAWREYLTGQGIDVPETLGRDEMVDVARANRLLGRTA